MASHLQRRVLKPTMSVKKSVQNIRFSVIGKDRSLFNGPKVPAARDVCDLFEACQGALPNFNKTIVAGEKHRDAYLAKVKTSLENSDVIVVAYDGSVQGLWMLKNTRRIIGMGRAVSDGALVATLHDIMVHPEYQRQGIGRRIVKLLTTYLDTRMDVIDVGVVVVNDGGFERFLERSGFGEDDEGSTAMLLRVE